MNHFGLRELISRYFSILGCGTDRLHEVFCAFSVKTFYIQPVDPGNRRGGELGVGYSL